MTNISAAFIQNNSDGTGAAAQRSDWAVKLETAASRRQRAKGGTSEPGAEYVVPWLWRHLIQCAVIKIVGKKVDSLASCTQQKPAMEMTCECSCYSPAKNTTINRKILFNIVFIVLS